MAIQQRAVDVSADVLQPEGGWIQLARPRIAPPTAKESSLLLRSLSGFSKAFGRREVPDVLTVYSKNSRLFWPWLFFASRLMPFGQLPAQVREKIILRTGWNCRSRYEWGQHVEIALRVGVSDQEIVRLTQGSEAATDPVERAILSACDEIYAHNCIADETWQTLSAHYSEKLLIEITVLIGHYVMVAGFLNSAGLQLEEAIEDVLQAFYARIRT